MSGSKSKPVKKKTITKKASAVTPADGGGVEQTSAENKVPAATSQDNGKAKMSQQKIASSKKTSRTKVSQAKSAQEKTKEKTQVPSKSDVESQSSDNAGEDIQREHKQPSKIGKPSVDTVQKKSGTGLSVFAILLSLVAIAASAYMWYQINVLSKDSDAELAVGITGIAGDVERISDSVVRLQASQSNVVSDAQLSTRLLQAKVNADKQFDQLERSQQDLTETLVSIKGDLKKGTDEYVVDEVSQLLKLANNNVIFANDTEAAIKAFTLADTQLKELASPRYSEVRRKINEEIGVLRSIDQIDIESSLAKLSLISSTITTLPLENEPPVVEAKASAKELDDDAEITWRGELNKFWSDMLNSVSIQRVDQPPKPLLAPKERYFLNQNFQLMVTKAEIALLQGRQAVYVNSIAEASAWVNDYFDLRDKRVKKVVSGLNELKDIKWNQTAPSVAGSYDLLQSIKGGQ